MSLHPENSEPKESVECRRPCFSSDELRRAAECSSLGYEGDARVRSGIVTEPSGLEEGMMPVIVG